MKPSFEPDPEIAKVWPSATTLSGVPAAAFGQVKVMLLWLTVPPGVMPAAARAWAE